MLLIRSKLLRSTLFKISTSLFTLFFCPVFDPGEENKFSYTDIHNEYRKLVRIYWISLGVVVAASSLFPCIGGHALFSLLVVSAIAAIHGTDLIMCP